MNTLTSQTTPRSLFANPFSQLPAIQTSGTYPSQRPSRSPSSSSTASFQSTYSSFSTPSSLAEVLAQNSFASSFYQSNNRNSSFSSRCGSLGTSSFGDRRRSSCFSIVEAEEEKAEFGEQAVGMLEPRPGMGWWGVKEVLEDEAASRRGSLS